MQRITYWEVYHLWYDADTCSPSEAMTYAHNADFTDEVEAERYCQVLQAEHDNNVEHNPEAFSYNEYPEHRKYYANRRDIKLYENISDIGSSEAF